MSNPKFLATVQTLAGSHRIFDAQKRAPKGLAPPTPALLQLPRNHVRDLCHRKNHQAEEVARLHDDVLPRAPRARRRRTHYMVVLEDREAGAEVRAGLVPDGRGAAAAAAATAAAAAAGAHVDGEEDQGDGSGPADQ